MNRSIDLLRFTHLENNKKNGLDLVVRKSTLHGKGLFTKKKIKEGTLLGYCQVQKVKRHSAYTLYVGNTPHEVICKFRFINHHPKPNVIYYDDFSIVSLRNIAAGEELTHHYGVDWT